MNDEQPFCTDCGLILHAEMDKAVGSGEWKLLWADRDGSWVCARTGNEHVPQGPDLVVTTGTERQVVTANHETRKPVQIIVKHGSSESMVRLTYAEAGNFVFNPIIDALHESDAALDLNVSDAPRLASLELWASRLFEITGD